MKTTAVQKTESPLQQWLCSALLVLGIFVLCLCLFGIRYDTNDDAILSNIAAGAYGAQSERLVYVNILLGFFLKPFYHLAAWNWYVLWQLAAVLWCLVWLCRLLMQRLGTAYGALAGVVFTWCFGLRLFYMFQYTQNSGVLLATGLVLVAGSLGTWNARTTTGIVMVLLGSMLRFNNFMAVGALSACLLLARFFALDARGKKNAVCTMALLFALVFGAKVADTLSYTQSDTWREYAAYNAARTQLSDYKAQTLPEENPFGSLGYSDNDYAELRSWDYYDAEVFPAEKVQAAADLVAYPGFANVAKSTLKNGVQLLWGTPYRVLFTAVLLLCFALCRKRTAWALPCTGAIFAALLFYLTRMGRFPARVETVLLFAVCCFLGALFMPTKGAFTHRKRTVLCVCAVFLLVVSLFTAVPLVATARGYREFTVLEEESILAMGADKENLYLISTETINIVAGFDVWHPREKDFFSNIVAVGGWLSRAPHRDAALAAFGLTYPLRDAVDNPHVYLAYHGIERNLLFVQEHTIPSNGIEAVYTQQNPICCYRLQSLADSDE